ncbi:MAG TPA: FecR domain-containing protein [Mucilaginibacter sp.]|nr:FecR domain-containing protein [Mucilaginibacter sp.]
MKAANNHITDDLLVKHLLGETNEAEARVAELWINANDANSKYYNNLKLIWQESERIAPASEADEDAAWMRLQSRIRSGNTSDRPRRLTNTTWLSIAASILLICTISYFGYTRFFSTRPVSMDSGRGTLTQNLPDGSSVTLNSNSRIVYPAHFRGDERLVRLSGEGFFKVSPDKTKPFIIKINAVTVSVVGTSFNIKDTRTKTEVVVETGIVKVNLGGKQVTVHPHQKVIADKNTNRLMVLQNNGSLYNYYITNALICDGTPLAELVEKLNQVYGSKIQIADPKLRGLPITTTFKGQTLQQVLKVIAETFKIQVEKKGDKIILKQAG